MEAVRRNEDMQATKLRCNKNTSITLHGGSLLEMRALAEYTSPATQFQLHLATNDYW